MVIPVTGKRLDAVQPVRHDTIDALARLWKRRSSPRIDLRPILVQVETPAARWWKHIILRVEKPRLCEVGHDLLARRIRGARRRLRAPLGSIAHTPPPTGCQERQDVSARAARPRGLGLDDLRFGIGEPCFGGSRIDAAPAPTIGIAKRWALGRSGAAGAQQRCARHYHRERRCLSNGATAAPQGLSAPAPAFKFVCVDSAARGRKAHPTRANSTRFRNECCQSHDDAA